MLPTDTGAAEIATLSLKVYIECYKNHRNYILNTKFKFKHFFKAFRLVIVVPKFENKFSFLFIFLEIFF